MNATAQKEFGIDLGQFFEAMASKYGLKVGMIREATFLELTGHVGWEVLLSNGEFGDIEMKRANA